MRVRLTDQPKGSPRYRLPTRGLGWPMVYLEAQNKVACNPRHEGTT